MRYADLHLHSTFSDGLLTPVALAQACAEQNLDICCLTDHDTIGGYTEFAVACASLQIETFPGIELSTTFKDTGFHILGYGFDVSHGTLNAHLNDAAENRESRVGKILEKLDLQGISLEESELAARGKGSRYGRPQIADAMVEKGYVASFTEAFDRYLGTDGTAYVPYYKIDALHAIALIHAAGGTAIIAHPGLQNRDELVKKLIGEGIDGIEIIHPEHPDELVVHYTAMATTHNLLVTGGSDYHARPQDLDHLGKFKIAESKVIEFLKAARD